jgi:hypothetical protein
MSCECVTCWVCWMKINEIHLSFGEVLWWDCVTWHTMRRGGSCFYSTLDMWSWPVCFLMMSFHQQWCDICVLQTTFFSMMQFLRYDAFWVLLWMALFYHSTICATLLWHVSTQIYYMQGKCCVFVPFPSESLKNLRSWVYLLYWAVASVHGTP